MSNQLTPMQEAIEKVNQLAMDNKTIKQVVFILTELLPKEQQVIEDLTDLVWLIQSGATMEELIERSTIIIKNRQNGK